MNNPKRDINELLNVGTMAQIEKLKENSHKPDFEGLDIGMTFIELFEEVVELGEEIYDNFGVVDLMKVKKDIDLEATRREAADVANNAHIIVLNCVRQLKGAGK